MRLRSISAQRGQVDKEEEGEEEEVLFRDSTVLRYSLVGGVGGDDGGTKGGGERPPTAAASAGSEGSSVPSLELLRRGQSGDGACVSVRAAPCFALEPRKAQHLGARGV